MNLTRTYLTLLLICIAHLTHAKDKAEVEPKGPIKRYTYKLSGKNSVPYLYTCYYDKQGRKTLDTSYSQHYQPGHFLGGRIYTTSQYTYNGRFTYITGYRIAPKDKVPFVYRRDTLEYNEQQQLVSKTEWKFIIDTLHDVSTYAYYPDGRLKEEMLEHKKASKMYGFGKEKTTYKYAPRKEIITTYHDGSYGLGWSDPLTNTTREFDDSGKLLIQTGYLDYDDLRQYTQVAYSDGPQQPTPARRKGKAREIDLRYYWHRDHHGNYLKKAWLKRNKLKGIIERTIEYYE